MKKKEMTSKCSVHAYTSDLKERTTKSTWDTANEWRKLGKDEIHKMETEKISVLP